MVMKKGSSPLARGLRRSGLHIRVVLRIIPARAGSTRSRGPPSCPTRDHPRSRGVYPRKIVDGIKEWGSSPLARGLPDWDLDNGQYGGIIPARAGSTPYCRRQ